MLVVIIIIVLHQCLEKVVFEFAPKAFYFKSCEIVAIKVGHTKKQSEMNAFAREQNDIWNLLYQKKILLLKNVLYFKLFWIWYG